MTTTVLTRGVARLLLAPVVMVALAVLVKGYVDVGDGFAGGIVAALGLLLQYVAFGRRRSSRALPVRHAPRLAVAGLLITLAVAFVPVRARRRPARSTARDPGRTSSRSAASS